MQGLSYWLCYYKLPLWWHQLARAEGTKNGFPLVRDLYTQCRAVAGVSERTGCLHGLGHLVAPMAGYEPQQIRVLCAAVDGSFQDHLICVSNAAYSVLLEKGGPKGIELCRDFNGKARAYCEAYATTMVQRDIAFGAAPTENH